jgi:hypothetical protein
MTKKTMFRRFYDSLMRGRELQARRFTDAYLRAREPERSREN